MREIEIDDSDWQPTFPGHDPRSRLHASVTLNGALFHLTAFRVTTKDDVQAVDCDEHEAEFEDYANAASPAGPFEVIEVEGAPYVVFGEAACS